jgi:glycosyltransferase involved in cell wall biosynthesis
MLNDIHIIAPFMLANDGDWQAIDLYLQYNKTHRVTLWSPRPAHNALKVQYPIQEIKPYSGQSPSTGTLIICGAHTEIGHWYENTHFDKVILIHNLVSPTVLYKALNRLTLNGTRKVELVYVSEMVKQIAGLAGEVIHHIPHADRLKPIVKNSYHPSESFTVGRINTDVLSKHHHGDPKVYRALADLDMQVRVIGGTCLAPWVNQKQYQHHNINLLPMIPQIEVAQTYSTLDCFYYRTPSTVREAYGLVVIEAMLSGLPVVCHRSGGYADVIEHGVNGFLFDTENEAIELINLLKKNANLCEKIGNRAKSLAVEFTTYNLD